MFIVVKDGVRLSGMGAWGGNLKDVEIWTVVTFLQRVRTLPLEVSEAWNAERPGGEGFRGTVGTRCLCVRVTSSTDGSSSVR